MRIEIRNDSVLLDGYVNAVLRDSRPIPRQGGTRFVEQIMPHAFSQALERAPDIEVRLNHERVIGTRSAGDIELFEDAIGLRAIATIKDPEVIQKAREKKLRGWSFGFIPIKDRWEDMTETTQRRYVEEMELLEVTIVDDRKMPAYFATTIETRDDKETITELRPEMELRIVTDDRTEPTANVVDYSLYESEINKIKGENTK